MPESSAAKRQESWTLPPKPEPNERGEVVVPVNLAEEVYDAMASDDGWEVQPGFRLHLMNDRNGGITILVDRRKS